MGVPVVCPSNRPDMIWIVSDSLRGVVIFDWPGRRRSKSGWISDSDSLSRGGQPSTTTPTPPPCDSPHVVIRNKWPKELDMRRDWGKSSLRSKMNLDERISSFRNNAAMLPIQYEREIVPRLPDLGCDCLPPHWLRFPSPNRAKR